jgi:hypothetical protein
MTQEQRFLDLMSEFEACWNQEQRENLMAEIEPLAEQVHFSRKMWRSLTERLRRVGVIGEAIGRQN